MPRTLAITSGEPAGIGPELCAHLATRQWALRPVVIGDIDLIASRLGALAPVVKVRAYRADQQGAPGVLDVLHVPLSVPAHAGQLDARNARYVLRLLDEAVDGCREGVFSGMVTAPVHKAVINDAGISFSGHTEYLAARTGTDRVVMMLVGGGLRVALVTTHMPLSQVPAAITRPVLERTLRIVEADLRNRFALDRPHILVAGLNPHAGESGHLGREEIDVIEPVVSSLRDEGMRVSGPLPADTLFVPRTLEGSDAQLAMYHDQGLSVLKYASFGEGVNVTLGLPIVRTSVDHGTALELAGSGRAEPGSLFAAVELAARMVCNEARNG